MSEFSVAHLFCGLGGAHLGFRRAGFRCAGAIDFDAAACRDFETLTGERATVGDLTTLSPSDLRAICGEQAPDVVFTSPPCKGFSGCLPEARSETAHYQSMNSLAFRGMWLVLEAWRAQPPKLLLLENVPRIQSRGRAWLDQIVAMLHAYGYSVAESTHDCGELGGLAQHRRRFLLVARHMPQVEAFLRVPSSLPLKTIGDVLGELPVPAPGSSAGGPMHRLPKLAAINWVRLALIPAGGDWRDIPPAVRLPSRGGRPNGPYGVEPWNEPAHAVLGHTTARDTWGSVADPRVGCVRREGGHGVKGWGDRSAPVIGHASIDNFPCQVADPRMGCKPRRGVMGVQPWSEPSHCIRAHHNTNNAAASVADPRIPELTGGPIDIADKRPTHLVIRAADGTWHRPMTTLELAALQGFPTRLADAWLVLDGASHQGWRERIGNAVPPPAAEAIARSCLATLSAARDGAWTLDARSIWVRRSIAEVSA